jgi:hypothetical protein
MPITIAVDQTGTVQRNPAGVCDSDSDTNRDQKQRNQHDRPSIRHGGLLDKSELNTDQLKY